MTPTPFAHEITEEGATEEENGKKTWTAADSKNQNKKANGTKPTGPLVVGMLVAFSLWTLLVLLKPHKPGLKEAAIPAPMQETDSVFLSHINLLMKTGENQKALRELSAFHEKSIEKESVDHLVPYAALLILEKESAPRAKKFLETILAKPVDSSLKAKAHLWMGYLMLNEGEGDLGENQFLESLQMNPKDPAARFNLGRVYLKQEKYSQALDYLNLAELEAPDLWLIHLYKGRVKWALGQIEEARHSFKAAIQLSPDRWFSYIFYSLFLKDIQELENAQSVIKSMLTKDVSFEIESPTPLGFFQEKVNYKEYLNAFNQVMAKPLTEEREIGKLYLNYLSHGSDEDTPEVKRIKALAERGNLTTKLIALKVLLDTDASVEQLKFTLGFPSPRSQLLWLLCLRAAGTGATKNGARKRRGPKLSKSPQSRSQVGGGPLVTRQFAQKKLPQPRGPTRNPKPFDLPSRLHPCYSLEPNLLNRSWL